MLPQQIFLELVVAQEVIVVFIQFACHFEGQLLAHVETQRPHKCAEILLSLFFTYFISELL